MLHEPSMESSGISAAEMERLRRDSLCPSERADAVSYDWARVGFGIVLAGGAYPLMLVSIFVVVGTVGYVASAITGNQNIPRTFDAISIVIMILLYSGLAAFVGVLWSGLVASVTLPVVFLFAWSLRLRASIVRIGAFAGGLVGFICILPATLSRAWLGTSGTTWETFLTFLVGPMLTTVLGQLGGAWGGTKSREVALNQRSPIVALPNTSGSTCSEPSGSPVNVPPRLQFSIKHLLWISVWLSLLLALIRVCGIPFELFLPIFLGWLVFQFAVLLLGGRLLQWFLRRRERRRHARST